MKDCWYRYGHQPIELTPDLVADIQERGGTILGSSRGPQDVGEMVDTLERMNVGVLFAIGGDGTLRGAGAIAQEVGRRNLKISVIGVPKTIDNDISAVDMSFGFVTAVSEARASIYAAHTEAMGARNGVGLVKLDGEGFRLYCSLRVPCYEPCEFLFGSRGQVYCGSIPSSAGRKAEESWPCGGCCG